MKKEISVAVRFLIGIRWDGRETKLSPEETGAKINNPAQYCLDRQWTRIEGVGADWKRFPVYTNPYPIVLGYGSRPTSNPGPTPEWELKRRSKAEAFAEKERAAKERAKIALAAAAVSAAVDNYF